jgi:hypothetical protein
MITHVSVAVMYGSDQDASLDFYVNKLGFNKKIDEEMWPGARWLGLYLQRAKHRSSCPARQRLTSSQVKAPI